MRELSYYLRPVDVSFCVDSLLGLFGFGCSMEVVVGVVPDVFILGTAGLVCGVLNCHHCFFSSPSNLINGNSN